MAPKKEEKKRTSPINAVLKSVKKGIMKLSRGRMFHKRGLWHIEKWKKTHEGKPKPSEEKRKTAKPARVIKKQVKGDKNGGTRQVRAIRFPRFYPTEDKPRKLKTSRKAFSQHKHTLRASITPGTILILVAGRHAGKRVVFLKQLSSGLLLVTGPFKLNRCPLRRVNQNYVIATKTKLDLSKVNVPENLQDKFFNRIKTKKAKKPTEGEIFDVKKEKYEVNEERKQAQLNLDSQIITAIKSHADKTVIKSYLKSRFALKNRQYPHKMQF
jgi:large subunit ribosomal protein L6e